MIPVQRQMTPKPSRLVVPVASELKIIAGISDGKHSASVSAMPPGAAVLPSICFENEAVAAQRWSRRQPGFGSQVRKGDRSSVLNGICSIGVGRSQLARRLSSPSLECMSECAHLMKAEQPRNLGYMHPAVVEVTNR
jgi:hypothetical protein